MEDVGLEERGRLRAQRVRDPRQDPDQQIQVGARPRPGRVEPSRIGQDVPRREAQWPRHEGDRRGIGERGTDE
jgi:hypothetical protein